MSALMDGAASRPDAEIGRLPLLAEAERRRILEHLSRGAEAPVEPSAESERRLHRLVEEQCRRAPGREALRFGDESWTYDRLVSTADAVSRRLAAAGVGPESRVGLAASPGPEMVAAALGVMRAGAAYVPLEPTLPAHRLELMARDAEVVAVLTDAEPSWEVPEGVAVLRMGGPEPASVELPAETPADRVDPDQAAYVLYTSGSTGRPKGVVVPHGALVEYLSWARRRYGVDEETESLVHSPLGFDLTVTALFSPLLAGGTVRLLPQEESVEALAHALERHEDGSRRLLVKLTPSHLRILGERPGSEGLLAGVDRLIVGGEALAYGDLEAVPEDRLRAVNEYGPTEAVVGCAFHEVEAGGEGAVPIGRPVPGARLYVADEELDLLPRGIAGELLIGGSGLARGYEGSPASTAESFVPDPFGDEPGARLYRSGDLARFRGDGELEFLGRIDEQIKLRGFRIEPGEIESCLSEHPGVRRAAVVLWRDEEGDEPKLVAYTTSRDQSPPKVEELHEFLLRRLPAAMVPTAFVALDAFPLTPNGKVDRKALPDPPSGRPDFAAASVSPRDPLEEAVTELWQELLGVDEVGIRDNFFLLGGHSLLATQLVSRVREAFGVEVDLNEFFADPTVAELARTIERGIRGGGPEIPPIEPVPRDGELPLSFAQQRLWFVDRMDPGRSVYNIPLAIRFTGPLEVPVLERTFGEVVRRHESLRTRFGERDGEPWQRIEEPWTVQVPLVDLSALPVQRREEAARRLAVEIADRPFDLSREVLWRAAVLRLEEEDHVGVVTFHHIVSDAWSMGVLIEEVSALYDAFVDARPSPLEDLRVQYADFANWQRQWLRDELLESQLGYWRRHLDGAPEVIQLPTDYPRPARPSSEGASEPFEAPAELSQRFGKLVRGEGGSLFMGLLAAFDVLLARLGGQEDLVVGSPMANRSRVETEKLIGFFVNVLPLRNRISAEMSFRELLSEVKGSVLGAVAHQDVPFERLVDSLGVDRRLEHSPIFQVVLSFQNAPMDPLDLAGLTLRPFGVRRETTKFDIVFNLRDTADGLRGVLQYRKDLFKPSTVRRMLGRYERLLEEVSERPDRPIGEIELLSEEDKAVFGASTVVEELNQDFLF
jgi:amino acid adenylation domain-containing protein